LERCAADAAQEHAWIESKYAFPGFLAELDTCSTPPAPVSADVRNAIMKDARDRLWGDHTTGEVCGVCNRLVVAAKVEEVELRGRLLARVLRRWALPRDMPSELRSQYDCSEVPGIEELASVGLSPRGVRRDGPRVLLTLCRMCLRSRSRPAHIPPRFAIANKFSIGLLPDDLLDSTCLEMRLMCMVTVCMSVGVVRGGANRVLRSHVGVFDARPATIVTQLPRVLEDSAQTFMVILAGLLSSAKELAVLRAHRVRGQRLRQLFEFFTSLNKLYGNGAVSRRDGGFVDQETHLEHDQPAKGRSHASEGSGGAVDATSEDGGQDAAVVALDRGMAADQSNVRQRVDTDVTKTSADELLVRRAAGVHLNVEGVSSTERLEAVVPEIGRRRFAGGAPVVIRQGGALVSDQTLHLVALMFQGFFPFGRGDPDEPRRVSVSRAQCLRHYALLSSRRFAQDTVYPLVAFDIVARHMALSRATLNCRMGGAEQNVAVAHVSESQLAALLEYDASCLAAARNNEPRPGVPPTLGSAKVLSNRVRAAAGYAPGSNAQRQVQQRRGFGLQTLFGSAFVFVMASPKDNGSLTVAYLAGDVEASKLIHVGSRDLPAQAQRFASSAKDPVAAARYFHRASTTFFEVLLGYDMDGQRPLARGGIFGHLEALIAGVETQGDGTLHFHALGWIQGTPRLFSGVAY